jgi:tRNA(fMet)-specific endonuclease VapC
MNGKILLDTSIAVWWLRGGDRFRAFAQRFADDRALLPLIVVGEMLYGARRHHAPEEEQKRVLAFTGQFSLIGISFATADRYATLRADLSRAGTPIPENDIWIAALALEHNVALATHDRHFQLVPGLRLETW